MIKKASLLTACSVTAFSAWAQDTSPDTLVVTANRFEQPRSTVLAPTTVVTRQDIDRWQSTSVNDVLRRLPGVDITQNGGSGQLSSIFIRGTNASHVLVLIDGVGNDSNLLIVFYVQIMPDDFVMQLHRF